MFLHLLMAYIYDFYNKNQYQNIQVSTYCQNIKNLIHTMLYLKQTWQKKKSECILLNFKNQSACLKLESFKVRNHLHYLVFQHSFAFRWDNEIKIYQCFAPNSYQLF